MPIRRYETEDEYFSRMRRARSRMDEAVTVERDQGMTVRVGDSMVMAVNQPDWDVCYVEYPQGLKQGYLDALRRAGIEVLRVTPDRIYFRESWL